MLNLKKTIASIFIHVMLSLMCAFLVSLLYIFLFYVYFLLLSLSFNTQPVGRSGTMRVMSISSQDSGFTSQDTLYPRPPSSFSVNQVRKELSTAINPETVIRPFCNISLI